MNQSTNNVAAIFVDGLRARLRGPVITTGDAGYDEVRRI